MGNFTKEVTNNYQFDGDNITVSFKRLSRKDAMKLLPFIKAKEDGTMVMEIKEQFEFAEIASNILKGNITNFVGMFMGGEQVVIGSEKYNTVFEDVYFTSLIADIIKDIMEVSFLNSTVEKKSDQQAEGISLPTGTI